jgi:hypothetical protein
MCLNEDNEKVEGESQYQVVTIVYIEGSIEWKRKWPSLNP